MAIVPPSSKVEMEFVLTFERELETPILAAYLPVILEMLGRETVGMEVIYQNLVASFLFRFDEYRELGMEKEVEDAILILFFDSVTSMEVVRSFRKESDVPIWYGILNDDRVHDLMTWVWHGLYRQDPDTRAHAEALWAKVLSGWLEHARMGYAARLHLVQMLVKEIYGKGRRMARLLGVKALIDDRDQLREWVTRLYLEAQDADVKRYLERVEV